MHVNGSQFTRRRGSPAVITPIDHARKHTPVHGLGGIVLPKPKGPVPTVNPNAVVKIAK